jgi:hypothetical protein
MECAVVLIDRRNLSEHLPWTIGVALAAVAAAGWFLVERLRAETWPGGSSTPGLVFGTIGGAVILFEMLLWWRKSVRGLRIGPVKAWMRAHIWLGLLCLPLLVFHSGLSLGGWLSTVLLLLLLAVIGSGIWGLAVQQVLPARMLDEITAENPPVEASFVVSSLVVEAERLVSASFRPAKNDAEPSSEKTLTARTTARSEVTALHAFAGDMLLPYLRGGAGSLSPLRQSRRADVVFADLKDRLEPELHETADQLNALCDKRRHLDLQMRQQRWLHGWLCVHTPLSVALVVLMGVHVYVAFKWW